MVGMAKELLTINTCFLDRDRDRDKVGVGVNEGRFTLIISVSSHAM